MSGENGFLEAAGWGDAKRQRIPSDASDRRYIRIRRGDGTRAVLMRAPVAASDRARAQFEAFRRIGAWLRGLGLAAPEEFAVSDASGLMLLEDLGETALSHLLERHAAEAPVAYGAAVEVLARIAAAPPPEGLPRPDAGALAAMIDVTLDRVAADRAWTDGFRAALRDALGAMETEAPAVSLRDVHGDNLIWRPHLFGVSRIGLLDFQDALILPDGYDVASLLDDPRRTVPSDWRDELIAAYAARRGHDPGVLRHRVELLSLQRNLRIMGIFRRLDRDEGRGAYARFQPRTRTLVARAAARPGLEALRPFVDDLLARTAHWQEAAA